MAALPLSPRASATLETVNGSIMAAITSLGGSIWVHQLEQPGQRQQQQHPLSRLVSNVGNDAHLGNDVPLGPRFTVIVGESLLASFFGHRNDEDGGIQLIAAASKVLIAWARASLTSFACRRAPPMRDRLLCGHHGYANRQTARSIHLTL